MKRRNNNVWSAAKQLHDTGSATMRIDAMTLCYRITRSMKHEEMTRSTLRFSSCEAASTMCLQRSWSTPVPLQILWTRTSSIKTESRQSKVKQESSALPTARLIDQRKDYVMSILQSDHMKKLRHLLYCHWKDSPPFSVCPGSVNQAQTLTGARDESSLKQMIECTNFAC